MSAASYDGGGLRVSATTTPSGGSATTQGFVWDVTAQRPSLLMDSAAAYIYGPAGTPVQQVNLAAGTVTYLVSDALGSVRGVVSPSGSLTASTAYDAWGNPETAGGLTSYTPFGYAGGYTDPTGLLYLINRYYDPATGQFLSVDPQVSQTRQPYEYAGGNPVNASDPTGLKLFYLNTQYCNRNGCIQLNRVCDSNPTRCAMNWWFWMRGKWKLSYVPAGWRWYLRINVVYQVVGGQVYSHGEPGTYKWHGSWYNQYGPSAPRGAYKCQDSIGLWMVCYLGAHDYLQYDGYPTLILNGRTYYGHVWDYWS
jgi:RHS repeat-associated protein